MEDPDTRVKLAKELIRTAAECVKMIQAKAKKRTSTPGMVEKFLLDLGLWDEYQKTAEEKENEKIQGTSETFFLFLVFYCY